MVICREKADLLVRKKRTAQSGSCPLGESFATRKPACNATVARHSRYTTTCHPANMKRRASARLSRTLCPLPFVASVLPVLFGLTALAAAPSNVVLWDSGAAFSSDVSMADRSSWKPVPTDLLSLETDPPK